jgi:hypothetical protein
MTLRFDNLPLQQAHPGSWRALNSPRLRGAFALRSFVVCASRRSADISAKCGAVSNALGAGTPQPGHGCGASHSAMGCNSVNGPHSLHK